MSSSFDVDLDHPLQLRYPDLQYKTDHNFNQAHRSPSPSKQYKVPSRPLPHGDELQLQQMKLPQRRKFITLAEANSACYGLSYKSSVENCASLFGKRSSGLLDLAVPEGEVVISAQEMLPAMEESNEDELQEAVEMMKTKKKLQVQLVEHWEPTVDSQWKNLQRIDPSFRESMNLARTCRFCGKDFPSGRALGGHMRVHGALLFADSRVEQGRRSSCEPTETFGSANHAPCKRLRVIKASSNITSGSSVSQMDSQEVPNQTSKLAECRHRQEHAEEEEDEEAETTASRMMHLSSFDCSMSLVISNAGDEPLGYGDASLHEQLTRKKKSTSALYELRRNPKPNQRFFRNQEVGISDAIWPANSSMPTVQRSRSPSPDHESETARSCSECGKVFLSWKALFGHMRCHPERDWRGIQPPERSLELADSDTRLSTPKASHVETNILADNIPNCQQFAGSNYSTVVHLGNKEEHSDKSYMQEYGAFNSKLIANSEAAHATKYCSLNPLSGELPIESKQKLKEAHATEQAFKKSTGKEKSMKRVADHCPRSSKDAKGDWCPSWRAHNKRSKRARVFQLQSENANIFTSETISSQLRPNQHAFQLESQDDDYIVANSLMMLSNAGGHMQRSAFPETDHAKKHAKNVLKKGSGSTIQGHGGKRGYPDNDVDEPERKAATAFSDDEDAEYHGNIEARHNIAGVKYQCSTCKKCFNSHQALGGHRASHRKMKGYFTQIKNPAKQMQEIINDEHIAEEDNLGIEQKRMWQEGAQGIVEGQPVLWQVDEDRSNTCQLDATAYIPSSKTKGKGHECSICHRIFASGQALGGHKRCHWNGDRIFADTASVASSNKQTSLDESTCKDVAIRLRAKEDAIDLNLPAPLDEDEDGETTFDMSTSQGAVVQDEMLATMRGGFANEIGNSCATSTSWKHNLSDEWMFEDVKEVGAANFLLNDMGIDAGCGFDRRSSLRGSSNCSGHYGASGMRVADASMIQRTIVADIQ